MKDPVDHILRPQLPWRTDAHIAATEQRRLWNERKAAARAVKPIAEPGRRL